MVSLKTGENQISHLETIFKECKEYSFMWSESKCILFIMKLKQGRRTIDTDEFQLDQRDFDAIRYVQFLVTAEKLSQFKYCFPWMSAAIPTFHELVESLNNILEAAYKLTGKREKSSKKRIAFSKNLFGCNTRSGF